MPQTDHLADGLFFFAHSPSSCKGGRFMIKCFSIEAEYNNGWINVGTADSFSGWW